jgi:hypothetical protein
MGIKTMKADGCTLPLPLDAVELNLSSKTKSAGTVGRFRRFVETGDWEDVVNRLERPVDTFCWAAVAAAALVIIPICIRLLAE